MDDETGLDRLLKYMAGHDDPLVREAQALLWAYQRLLTPGQAAELLTYAALFGSSFLAVMRTEDGSSKSIVVSADKVIIQVEADPNDN